MRGLQPGPGNYNPSDPNIVSSRWGMGTSKRNDLAMSNCYPGPGN